MGDDRWRELCELIMVEKDPEKLLVLVEELNIELDRREAELRTPEKSNSAASE